ncbi:MAG: thioredoxin-dependent thiol peroxidase [Rhodospirillales bacterium]|nr:thioredoxin-dependent thiol peroxidase [Rhodospirillales bacterium]
MTIDPGDKAPDFDLPTDGGGRLKLSDLAGKKVVLYFYPKDSTPGCTVEARAFSNRTIDFQKAGAVIVGASKDSVKRHDKFKAKKLLTFALVSDTGGTLCDAYGVWVEKKLFGRKYMGIERATYLIDEKGTVRKVWRPVKIKGHADAVLAAVQAL